MPHRFDVMRDPAYKIEFGLEPKVLSRPRVVQDSAVTRAEAVVVKAGADFNLCSRHDAPHGIGKIMKRRTDAP
jgi:hypothetical protein